MTPYSAMLNGFTLLVSTSRLFQKENGIVITVANTKESKEEHRHGLLELYW
jgi:hypothetical protein